MRIFQNPILLTLLISVLALTLSPRLSFAQYDEEKRVDIKVIAEKTDITGAEEIWIAIDKSIIPHWHTYWTNPGDSGTELRINWTMPDGFEISDIQWPTPSKIPYEPLLNYGYEGNATLLQKLTIPKSISDNASKEPITLTADIELLVCKEECIPEYGTYTVTLNDTQTESGTAENPALFETATSKLPITVDWPATFTQDDETFKLDITIPNDIAKDIKPETLEFFPLDWGLIENAKAQTATLDETTLSFTQASGGRDYKELENSNFVLSYTNNEGRENSFEFNATQAIETITATSQLPTDTTAETAPTKPSITIAEALIFALLGGLVLNLMPCVFPVLSIKALSLVKIADEHPNLARMHGLSYTAGVILSFLAIAATLLVLKSAGAQIGWGFQLQNTIVVGGLAYLLYIIGLNLMGYFEFGNRLANTGNTLTQSQGLSGSFFTGILATLVATPCTAPFMAGAIGFALTQSPFINLTIFAALGLGLALPYLALSFAPALRRIMPKPGAWMNTFKELLAFPMFIASIWLVWVISKQAGPTGVLQILIGMSMITFGIWLLRKSSGKIILKIIAILTLAVSALMLIIPTMPMHDMNTKTGEAQQFGETFTPEKLETILAEEDTPVFVEMTADWCITCKVNHAVAVNIPSTKKAFAENNVRYLIGDWTNQDPEITKFLNNYGRNGVPIYVYYGPRNEETGQRPKARVLAQILTPGTLANLFKP